MPSPNSNPITVDLTPKLLESFAGRKRKVGRYSASEIYKMLTSGLPWGLPASKFFEVEEATPEGAMRMLSGIINHEQVQRFLDKDKNEIKMEYYFYGMGDERNFARVVPDYPLKAPTLDDQPIFTLVGKADHVPVGDVVWEIKTSETTMTKSKPWHDHQTKLYCTMFQKSQGLILQPMVEGDRLVLKEVGRVERDDVWFDGEMQKLLNYHERLEILAKDLAPTVRVSR